MRPFPETGANFKKKRAFVVRLGLRLFSGLAAPRELNGTAAGIAAAKNAVANSKRRPPLVSRRRDCSAEHLENHRVFCLFTGLDDVEASVRGRKSTHFCHTFGGLLSPPADRCTEGPLEQRHYFVEDVTNVGRSVTAGRGSRRRCNECAVQGGGIRGFREGLWCRNSLPSRAHKSHRHCGRGCCPMP